MTGASDQLTEAARLWAAHLAAPFPPRLRGLDIAGIDLVLLDADTAGCVTTWLDNGGWLDARRQTWLQSCLDRLDTVLPALSGDEATYYRRLQDLARLVDGQQPA